MSCGDTSKLKLPRNSYEYFDVASWERPTTLGIKKKKAWKSE